MRKHFFNNKDSGVFKNRDDATSTPLTAMGGNTHVLDTQLDSYNIQLVVCNMFQYEYYQTLQWQWTC